nr:MAG TPA: hypothetical protein [Caudoviricetes sp.]
MIKNSSHLYGYLSLGGFFILQYIHTYVIIKEGEEPLISFFFRPNLKKS